jgi:hypothetical protein
VGYGCRVLGCWVLRVLGWVCGVFSEGLGFFHSCKRWLSWDGFGGLLSFFFRVVFFLFKHCAVLYTAGVLRGA